MKNKRVFQNSKKTVPRQCGASDTALRKNDFMPIQSPSKAPKYLVLAEQLRAQIKEEMLQPGDRLPSFVEMRSQHGVTITTVERAYAHLEKDDLVVREQGRGTFVKEREARSLTNVIGVSGITLPQHVYFSQLMEGFQQVAAPAGFEILLLNEGTPITREKIDGVVTCDTGFAKFEKWRQLPSGMPCVTATVNARDFVSVVGDDYQGAYDLTQHLLQLGHRRIGAMYDPFLTARSTGYQNAMRDAKIEVDSAWMRAVAYDRTPDLQYTSAGYAVMREWLAGDWAATGCTALVTQNDDVALGVLRALSEAGWRVPEQVSVAGFDSTEAGRYFQPQITSVEVPLREIGAAAMELLLRQIRGEAIRASTTVLPARVLPGGTTSRPPA